MWRNFDREVGVEAAEYALMDTAEHRLWWYRALHARILDALAGVAGPVLDAGCGTGGLLVRLAQNRALAPIGVEFSPGAAMRAAAKSGVPVAVGSINALPFADGHFAASVTADVLCHAAVMPEVALAELHRVLRPGGLLVVNMPAYRWLLSAHDQRVQNVRRLTAGGLARWLVAAGFVRPVLRYWNSLLLPVMIAQRKLLTRRDAASDVATFPPWLDATFHAITEFERRRGLTLPAGGSILGIAERP
jgi:SAM-dependent methyltransferase